MTDVNNDTGCQNLDLQSKWKVKFLTAKGVETGSYETKVGGSTTAAFYGAVLDDNSNIAQVTVSIDLSCTP